MKWLYNGNSSSNFRGDGRTKENYTGSAESDTITKLVRNNAKRGGGTANKKIERSDRGGGSGRAAERGFGPSRDCGQAKNLYTRSERLAVSCRVIWAWYKRFNMQDSRITGPGSRSGLPNPDNLHRFSPSRQHWAATAVEVVVVV